jgi:hypothetical protein
MVWPPSCLPFWKTLCEARNLQYSLNYTNTLLSRTRCLHLATRFCWATSGPESKNQVFAAEDAARGFI